ncbi:GNAT family N-acetyltransferase [Clostridium diolis]|uniref:GNAT family N-acetyltransferase n=1 Tax=Clostridium diolis TaxID=223919 RepID=UPI003AF789D6
MEITLERISKEDCDLLFNWANDTEVRKNSFNSDKILYENHIKWFNNKINSDKCSIFILKENRISVGQVRIDIENSTVIISYSIDKNYRGKGLSVILLSLLEEKIRNNNINIKKMVGLVKFDNVASQKAFEALKFDKKICNNFLEYEKYLI